MPRAWTDLRRLALALALAFWASLAAAQPPDPARAWLAESRFERAEFAPRQLRFGFSERQGWRRWNPASLALGAALWVYQRHLSQQFFADCLFVPSCSAYSQELIRRHGLPKGVLATADRLTRCNRVAAAGMPRWRFDPRDGKIRESVEKYTRQP